MPISARTSQIFTSCEFNPLVRKKKNCVLSTQCKICLCDFFPVPKIALCEDPINFATIFFWFASWNTIPPQNCKTFYY